MVAGTVRAAFLIAVASLATHVQAQVSVAGGDNGPISIPSDSWDDVVKRANATSRALAVVGYDIEEEYPGTPQDGWHLSLAVVGNQEAGAGTRVTGAHIAYEPASSSSSAPTNGSSSGNDTSSSPVADNTWGSCSWFGYVPYDIEADVDAGCRGVLSDECVAALNDLVVDQGDLCYTAETMVPEACDEDLGEDSDALLLVAVGQSAGAFERPLGLTVAGEDDFAAYDRMVRSVFVGLVGFSMLRSDDGGTLQLVQDSQRIPGIVSCLRADNITAHSRPLEDTNAAVPVAAGPGRSWAALAVAIAVVVGFS
jgi:hypothetical protein